jgi:hypothetical protein
LEADSIALCHQIRVIDKNAGLLDKESKKAGTDTEGLESEVDTLVYWLYDLTDDEIAIVEGKDSMKEIILIH